ncbi:uncharacterized protein [Lepidochelys kempii]|uniref:uncharacterized protein isoform X3 n=1 Tax=Lepidochelys kempii TaxID=8472 RepID=UPI003C6F3DEB
MAGGSGTLTWLQKARNHIENSQEWRDFTVQLCDAAQQQMTESHVHFFTDLSAAEKAFVLQRAAKAIQGGDLCKALMSQVSTCLEEQLYIQVAHELQAGDRLKNKSALVLSHIKNGVMNLLEERPAMKGKLQAFFNQSLPADLRRLTGRLHLSNTEARTEYLSQVAVNKAKSPKEREIFLRSQVLLSTEPTFQHLKNNKGSHQCQYIGGSNLNVRAKGQGPGKHHSRHLQSDSRGTSGTPAEGTAAHGPTSHQYGLCSFASLELLVQTTSISKNQTSGQKTGKLSIDAYSEGSLTAPAPSLQSLTPSQTLHPQPSPVQTPPPTVTDGTNRTREIHGKTAKTITLDLLEQLMQAANTIANGSNAAEHDSLNAATKEHLWNYNQDCKNAEIEVFGHQINTEDREKIPEPKRQLREKLTTAISRNAEARYKTQFEAVRMLSEPDYMV